MDTNEVTENLKHSTVLNSALVAARAGNYSEGYAHSEFYAGCFAGAFSLMLLVEEIVDERDDLDLMDWFAERWYLSRKSILEDLERDEKRMNGIEGEEQSIG